MSKSNPIDLSSDSKISSSDSVWEEFLASRKTSLNVMRTNPSADGPSSIQPLPHGALKKESSSELSSMPSYVSPYEDTNDEASSRVLVVPPLAAIPPPEPLPGPPLQALLTAPPPAGPSSSSPPIRERVRGLACPKVWEVIGGQGVQKKMPEWAIARRP